jgi:hypothetical protein
MPDTLAENVAQLAALANTLPAEPAVSVSNDVDPTAALAAAIDALTQRVRALEVAFAMHTRVPAAPVVVSAPVVVDTPPTDTPPTDTPPADTPPAPDASPTDNTP